MRNILVCALLLSGCAVAFQERPAAPIARKDCGPSWWALDAVVVQASVATTVYGLAATDKDGEVRNWVAGIGVVTGIVALASAGNGRRWERECREGVAPTLAASR